VQPPASQRPIFLCYRNTIEQSTATDELAIAAPEKYAEIHDKQEKERNDQT